MQVLTEVARAISTTSRMSSRLVSLCCAVLIYVMLGLLATQILMRYFLGSPPSWTEEVAITFFAWLVFLYATVGFREGFHVAIETIPPTWNRLRSASEIIVAVLVAGFGAVSFVAGIAYVQRTAGQKSAALQWPIEILYLAVPVCGFLLVLHAVAIVLERGVLTDRLPKSDL